jgi:hypothetical protein
MFCFAISCACPPPHQSRKLKSRYGARNQFQEPSLEVSSQATYAGGPVRKPFAYLVPSPHSGTKVTDTAVPLSRGAGHASRLFFKSSCHVGGQWACLCCKSVPSRLVVIVFISAWYRYVVPQRCLCRELIHRGWLVVFCLCISRCGILSSHPTLAVLRISQHILLCIKLLC